MQSSPAPLFLTHAALALAGHHVLSAQFQDHRQAALQALRKGLDEMNSAHFYQVLDTIILLFSLDVCAVGLQVLALTALTSDRKLSRLMEIGASICLVHTLYWKHVAASRNGQNPIEP
jgi:hypothetical protein